MNKIVEIYKYNKLIFSTRVIRNNLNYEVTVEQLEELAFKAAVQEGALKSDEFKNVKFKVS